MSANLLQALATIVSYAALCIIFSIVAKTNIKTHGRICTSTIIIFSILFTGINILCTIFSKSLNSMYISDRWNYYVEFNGVRNTSAGLSLIFELAHWLNTGFDFVLYLTTFLSFFLTLYSMRNTKTITPIILLLCTDFLFISFHRLKQSLACAFGSIYLTNILENGFRKKRMANILLFLIATSFHPASLILIPATVLIIFQPKTKKIVLTEILLIIAILFFSNEIMESIATNTASFFPNLSQRIYSYILKKPSTTISTSFLRGIPFYCITMFGSINILNKKLKANKTLPYLILSIFVSIIYVISIKSYWLYRLADFFIVPMTIYFGYLYTLQKNSKEKTPLLALIILLQSVMTIRWIILMYTNYNGF